MATGALFKNSAVRIVSIIGLNDIMFDRYAGDNNTTLNPDQKVYLMDDGETLCLPATNILSLLTAQNTESAPKRLMDKRKYKDFANACRSFVMIDPDQIPFIRDGKPIKMSTMDGDKDPISGVYIHRSVARLEKGIPNPKVRPVLPAPWKLTFTLTILDDTQVNEDQLRNLIDKAGLAIGLGTYRGRYGKYRVEQWDRI